LFCVAKESPPQFILALIFVKRSTPHSLLRCAEAGNVPATVILTSGSDHGFPCENVRQWLASGFLHDRNVAPTIGMRLQF
jgi:hypothetical protein